MPSYFATLHSLSRPLFLYAFITHRHLLSLPISISSSYLNTVTISRRQLAPAFFQYYFILHLITFPIPCADQSDTSVPVAIYFLGPFRSPKHLFKYIISGILLHLYIFTFSLPFCHISFTPLLPPAVVSYNHPLPEPDGHRSYPSRHMFVFTSITELYLPIPANINQCPV
jgi:hypothetical protein